MQFKMLTAIATLTLAGACTAQTMYRCGSSFSQTPCAPDAKPVSMPKAAPTNCDSDLQACIRNDLAMAEKAAKTKVVDTPPADSVITANRAACEATARGKLKDPETARVGVVSRVGAQMQYRDGKTQPVVLYQVGINAKNSFGGYAGESQWRCYFNINESALISVSEGGKFR